MRAPRATLALALAAACAVLVPSPPARAGDPPPATPNPLRGSDLKALLEKAAELEAKDVRALGAALIGLGEPATERGIDLDFLVEFAVRETSRAPRILAVEAAQRVDAKAAAAAFLKRAKEEKDPVRATLAVESLGLVGTKEHVAPLLELLKHPSEMVSITAAEALARVATPKDVDEIFDAGLVHENSHVTDHTAWVVQDLVPKQKKVFELYEKVAGKKSDPRAIRADATLALLKDNLVQPHKWTPPFAAARAALTAAPATVPVRGSADHVKNVEAAVEWLRQKSPAEHWILCAAVTVVEPIAEVTETTPRFETDAIAVKLSDAVLPPHKIAYTLSLQAGVVWRKKIGEPHRSHRGWEPAIFDVYDVAVAAKLYDAGPGGLSRERFVQLILGKRPWGTL